MFLMLNADEEIS